MSPAVYFGGCVSQKASLKKSSFRINKEKTVELLNLNYQAVEMSQALCKCSVGGLFN